MKFKLLVVIVSLIVTSGCATITRGTKDTLVVESDPSGANVTLSNGLNGKTPASFKIPRSDSLVVKIEKEGYESVEVNITSQISGAGGAGMAGNVLLGGLVGAAVDAGTGAMKDLKPNPVSVRLVKTNPVGLSQDLVVGKTTTQRLEEIQNLYDNGLISKEEHQRSRKEILKGI